MKYKSFLVGCLMSALSVSAHAEVKTLTDILGNEVTLDLPAKRVALGFYFEDYLAVAGEEGWDNVVGISREAWEAWRPASWALYTKHDPEIEQLPDMGEVEAMTFSVEKVIEMKPDVLVLAEWQVLGLGNDLDQFKDAGIPIVVVDYNAQKLERHLESTTLLGEIAGNADRAEAINNDYSSAIEQINQRIQAANLPKPNVYSEFGNKGPEEFSFTYGKNMWGAMIEQAGGINIAKPFVEWWGPMNPEQILVSKPDVIVIAGTEGTKNPTALKIGQGVERSEAEKLLSAFASRPGWDSLPAIKNDRLVGVYQGASRTQADYTMVQYLAKAFYPELFQDIDPEQNYIDFYKKYLPVVPEGTFAVTVGDK